MIRYRFSDFTLSPKQRRLVRDGQEVPLIPRYFDLLLLLVERRHEAVHRQEIFDRVWTDAVVSESALSQAVRTIRRTLGDDSREPRFIRTVSRHGYQFVLPVIEEEEDVPAAVDAVSAAHPEPVVHVAAQAQTAGPRWTNAAAGGAVAGIVAGTAGAVILALAPESNAPFVLAPVLAVIGGACGALGGGGVGAGLSLGETRSRSPRALALILGGAAGGGVVGLVVQWLARWGFAALLGLDLKIGGALEGVAIGAAAGTGYAIATRSGQDRLTTAFVIAACCGMAGLAISLAGRPLVGGTIHAIAGATDGSRATLAPLGRLIGEPDFGLLSGAIIAVGEAATFGVGLAYGLTRRR